MRKLLVYILCLFVVILCSCAHKTGHRGRNQDSRQKVIENSQVEETREVRRSKPKVETSSVKREKMEGSQIFKKYSKAVFSVLNTKGENTIQGSGFFISNDGLAVSNYHVFQGCTIGEGYIKLVGDDTAYKVSEVYQRSEEQDFILFKVIAVR